MLRLKILYVDEDMLAVDKPAGFFTHPPEDKNLIMAPRWNALGILEKQVGCKLHPVHRLDRATSGILLYAKSRESAAALQAQFLEHRVQKTYHCFVRGRPSAAFRCEKPLRSKETLLELPAITDFRLEYSCSLPHTDSPSGWRDFSLVVATPTTGRFHQIRRHLATLSHPIIGDKRHGDKKVNRAMVLSLGSDTLYLRATKICIQQPRSHAAVSIAARWPRAWHKLFDTIGFCPSL